MPNMRLFVAVNLPPDIREHVWRATEPLRSQDLPIRWVAADLLHLTIKFLGDVDPTQVGDIGAALAQVAGQTRQHAFSIERMGAFPSVRKPRTVWAGCDPVPALELLHHGVASGLARLGFALDGLPFRPHITVGRVKRGASASRLRDFESELDQVQLSTIAPVSSVELMESHLSSSGPRYRVVRTFEFAS